MMDRRENSYIMTDQSGSLAGDLRSFSPSENVNIWPLLTLSMGHTGQAKRSEARNVFHYSWAAICIHPTLDGTLCMVVENASLLQALSSGRCLRHRACY